MQRGRSAFIAGTGSKQVAEPMLPLLLPLHTTRDTTELIQHPNGAAPTCHTVFAVDRGCPWEKAKKLLDEEVSE